MTKFDVSQVADNEFLTPSVMRYIDRLIDLKDYKRKLKISRLKSESNVIEILVMLEDEKDRKTLIIYEMGYYDMGSLEATLNSPRLIKAINIYDLTQVERAWARV